VQLSEELKRNYLYTEINFLFQNISAKKTEHLPSCHAGKVVLTVKFVRCRIDVKVTSS